MIKMQLGKTVLGLACLGTFAEVSAQVCENRQVLMQTEVAGRLLTDAVVNYTCLDGRAGFPSTVLLNFVEMWEGKMCLHTFPVCTNVHAWRGRIELNGTWAPAVLADVGSMAGLTPGAKVRFQLEHTTLQQFCTGADLPPLCL